MRRISTLAVKGLVTILLLPALCLFSVWYDVLSYTYMAPAVMGAFVVHVFLNPPGKREYAGVFLVSIGLAIAYRAILNESLLNIDVLAFLGLGSVAVQAWTFLWGERTRRERTGPALLAGVIFPVFLILSAIGLAIVAGLNPKTFDNFLYVFDSSLGSAPSFVVGQFLFKMTALKYLCYYAYEFLPLAMSVAFVLDRKNCSPGAPNLLSVFVTVGLWGYVAYHVCPAVGPIHVWAAQFPWNPPQPGTVALERSFPLPSARNAMPSLHLGMALVIWLASRSGPKWWRVISAALVILTAIATLGFGEHYLVDLVVAVPFIVSAMAWCTSTVSLRKSARWLPAFGGALLTAAWLLFLRSGVQFFENRRLLAWLSILLTVAAPLILEIRLARFAARSVIQTADPARVRQANAQPFGLVEATE